MQFRKTEQPFVNVDWMFVAYGCSFEEIIGIFLCFGLSDVLLDVFVESDGLVQIYCFLVIEIDIIEYLLQFCFLLTAQLFESFLFRDQCAAEESI